MKFPAFLRQHTVTVEPLLGTGPKGTVYGAPVEVRGLLRQQTKLVRNPAGEEATSSSQFFAPLETVAPARSRVTLPGGRTTTVIASVPQDGGKLPVPSHLEVQLQ
ncbi:hypothetical protein HHX38_08375 [Streptomyces sp. PKU-MA01144]|uniref:hypothetical protein n=1 Tax=Streptomyces sp. PKU-MA01144 TaxID=2729138 RepID=UPI00147CF405|nr:hypothetical protein [Streptomyces sp. PKU-MA01144]NNJ04149.1 hypothetical protein [Streptomyces sp. PKU-MA01144]